MSRAVVIICVLDTGAMVASLPYSLHMRHRGGQCWEDWQGPARRLYGVFLFISQFTVPMVVSSAAYTIIINKLATRGGARQEEVREYWKMEYV